jgi:hypothetical protein
MGPDKEQEEAFEGQRIEAEADKVTATTGTSGPPMDVVPVVNPGKCPTCGRDR